MTAYLVWLLIVGEAGGHNSAAQLGPFATSQDCQRVANSEPLKVFNRQCMQVWIYK